MVLKTSCDVAVDDPVDDVRPALRDLVDPLDRQSLRLEEGGGAAGRDQREAEFDHRLAAAGTIWSLSVSLTDTNTVPASGRMTPPPSCDLAKAMSKLSYQFP